MPKKIAKSYAITDAKISFVSLVDKAANKREFLITKSEGKDAEFQTFGRILRKDAETHYVTGIVYEPMVDDTDDNYMTEEEITKAAHWFMKNSGKADIQHSFEKAENVEVVESYVAKSDMEIDGQPIKKGTWIMTMEVADPDVWDRIEKGEITGFSMGGKGTYSDVDVDISDPDNPVEKSEGKGILKRLAKMLGMNVDVVEKGAVKDSYNKRIVNDNFWTAMYVLSDQLLDTYNPATGKWEQQHDATAIRDALEDFNEIVTGLLAEPDEGLFKSIEKAGKKMSAQNKETLQGIYESLGTFLTKFEDEEEGEDVSKSEMEKIVQSAIEKAMSQNNAGGADNGSNGAGEVTKGDNSGNGARGCTETTEGITAEDVEKMVAAAVEKAMKPKEEPLTKEAAEKMIEEAVAKAMGPVLESAGLPSNLNNEGNVSKGAGEEHYLHGII